MFIIARVSQTASGLGISGSSGNNMNNSNNNNLNSGIHGSNSASRLDSSADSSSDECLLLLYVLIKIKNKKDTIIINFF